MLKELRLTNIVLIEQTQITFSKGFHVLSGESGSGKSAIMNGLSLLAGDRGDTSLVRHGADKGIVEAIFDISQIPNVASILEAAGIDHQLEDDLFIRREIYAAGKSRAFINNQLAQLTLLRQISTLLFKIVGQHANQNLLLLEYHKDIIDLFYTLERDVNAFEISWKEENEVRNTLHNLIQSETQRLREIEVCRMEIEELEQANLKDGEEEELFAEYTLLANSEELAEKAANINKVLSGEKTSPLTLLSRQISNMQELAALAPSLKDSASAFSNALIELSEIAHTLRHFESRIEANPERSSLLDSRLELIAKLKRKYGSSIPEIYHYLQKSKEKLHFLETADIHIEELTVKLEDLSSKNHQLASQLTSQRTKAAQEFQQALTEQLHSLNMPKALFFVDITPQKRTHTGDDKIEFFMTPNTGEKRISLRECASGGELSRTMLAIQAVLAGKEKTPTLIFDEIDANIGGETASIVGAKLNDISNKHQVLCITHFPQVAKLSAHHLRISKHENNGRTITQVELLDQLARHHEIARMYGN